MVTTSHLGGYSLSRGHPWVCARTRFPHAPLWRRVCGFYGIAARTTKPTRIGWHAPVCVFSPCPSGSLQQGKPAEQDIPGNAGGSPALGWAGCPHSQDCCPWLLTSDTSIHSCMRVQVSSIIKSLNLPRFSHCSNHQSQREEERARRKQTPPGD
jgi:hypothetical protein